MNPRGPARLASLVGQADFAKRDDRLDQLVLLQVGRGRATRVAVPRPLDAKACAEIATALQQAESAATCARVDDLALRRLPLLAAGAQAKALHPLRWVCVDERKPLTESRGCHTWFITLQDDGLWLAFDHGELGYRQESCESWSAAFARLAQLLSGACTWFQFGDQASRVTMMGKGQFYWQDPSNGRYVPVDNFMFDMPGGHRFKLEGVSRQCVLSYSVQGHDRGFEWCADWADGVQRLAQLLSGEASTRDIGSEGKKTGSQGVGAGDATPDLRALAPQGKFVVACIYADHDLLDAPVLAFKAAEGRQAVLALRRGGWDVKLCNSRQQWRSRRFARARLADALRLLGSVLKGTVTWRCLGADILAKR